MLEPRNLTLWAILLRTFTAIALGGLIGRERGLKNRPAGMRTYMLVCIGASSVMMINQYVCQVYGQGDPLRLGAQVISGIGFLGAGTIIVTSHNQIKGLTTAAGLWASACLGLAVGIGLYEVALTAGAGVYGVLTALHNWDERMRSRARLADLYVELEENRTLTAFIRSARAQGLDLRNIQREEEGDGVCFLVTVESRGKLNSQQLLKAVSQLEGVAYGELL